MNPNVSFHWWKQKANLGDELTNLILSKRYGFDLAYADLADCDAIGIGSILSWPWHRNIFTKRNGKPLHVLGSGLMEPTVSLDLTDQINLHAVRGYLTQTIFTRLGYKEAAVGDMGIVVDKYFPMERVSTPDRIGIIPHHGRVQFAKKLPVLTEEHIIIDLRTSDIGAIVRQLAQCKYVISQSLHGLIMADAYAIPNVWIYSGALHKGGDFKFLDYFSTVGRSPRLRFENWKRIGSHEAIEDLVNCDFRGATLLKSQVDNYLNEFEVGFS